MRKTGIVYEFHPSHQVKLVEDLREEGFELREAPGFLSECKYYFITQKGISVDGVYTDRVITNSRAIPGLDDFLERWKPSDN